MPKLVRSASCGVVEAAMRRQSAASLLSVRDHVNKVQLLQLHTGGLLGLHVGFHKSLERLRGRSTSKTMKV